jgi:hypothetical protein
LNFGKGGRKGHLLLLGGIQINVPNLLEDFFQPLMFEMRTLDGPKVDLMDAFEAIDSPPPAVSFMTSPARRPSSFIKSPSQACISLSLVQFPPSLSSSKLGIPVVIG